MADSPEFKLPMDVLEIQKCIPHRYPFLLIDRVLELKANESIVATKNVSISDPILQGHFPKNPLVPGVLIVEAMAQACGVLGYMTLGSLEVCLLTEVSKARFKRPVVPGDVMKFEVTLTKARKPFHWFRGVCTVDGELAASVDLSAFIK
jgi:3-hydroxyacyl-[acyl-carrier-protein] dehydratase